MSDLGAPKGVKMDPKKVKIIAGVGAIAAGYLYYRNRQAASAAPAAPGDAVTDTGLGVPTSTGPGAYATDTSAASSTTVGTVTTNADWYSAALTAVEDAGYDSGTAATALSLYLGNQPLTAAQQTIVRVGLAAAGSPPVGTFTIITAPDTTTDTTTTAATVWPAVTRLRGGAARTSTSLGVQWDPSLVSGQPPPNGYTVRTLSMQGKQVALGQTSGTSFNTTGLKANTRYDIQVWPGGVSAANKHTSIYLWTAKK
jgi:hypothetical protein